MQLTDNSGASRHICDTPASHTDLGSGCKSAVVPFIMSISRSSLADRALTKDGTDVRAANVPSFRSSAWNKLQ